MRRVLILIAASALALTLPDCTSNEKAPLKNTSTEPVETEVVVPEPIIKETREPELEPEQKVFSWYQHELTAIEEGLLIKSEPQDGLRFRFLWFRSFHKPYVVRGFEGDDGKIKLHMRAIDLAPGVTDLYEKTDDVFVHLTPTQSAEVLTMLDGLALCGDYAPPTVRGTDGARWLFESAQGGTYCLRQFHSSASDADFEKHKVFGLYLLKASRVKTWEIDVY